MLVFLVCKLVVNQVYMTSSGVVKQGCGRINAVSPTGVENHIVTELMVCLGGQGCYYNRLLDTLGEM